MNHTTPVDFDALTEREKNNTLYLRGLRAELEKEMADHLSWWMEDNDARKYLNQVILFTHPTSAYNLMNRHLFEHRQFGSLPRLELFLKVCKRIARLEREACHVPLEGELATA